MLQYTNWKQYCTIKSKNMDQHFDRVLFQATFSNFISQIFDKQLQAHKIQLDLLRVYEGKSENIGNHTYIIKYCRKTIDATDCIIKDIRDYFNDLKIPQLYTLIQTIFKCLVYTLKILSECYLRRFDNFRSSQSKENNNQYTQTQVTKEGAQKKKSSPNTPPNKSRKFQYGKMEQLDFIINGLQRKENQLQNQMHILISNIKDQKQKIQKIDSTIGSNFYQEMVKIFSDISNKSEYMFNNHILAVNENQAKNYFMKPEDFQQQINLQQRKDINHIVKKKIEKVCHTLTGILKQKFTKIISQKEQCLQKTLAKIKKDKEDFIKSQKSRNNLKLKSQKQIKKRQSQHQNSIQKQINEKLSKKTQQVDALTKQLDQFRRQNKFLAYEIEEFKSTIKKQKSQYAKLQYQNKQLQKLFKQRTIEFQQTKKQLYWANQKKANQAISPRKSQAFDISASKNLKNNLANKPLLLQEKQTQTQQTSSQTNEDLFSRSTAFQHKSFMYMRSKHKRKSTSKSQTNTQKYSKKNDSNLKSVLQKMIQILFQKKGNKKTDKNVNQQQLIMKLIQNQKYEQVIQKIKQKLDLLQMQNFNIQTQLLGKKTLQKRIKSSKRKFHSKKNIVPSKYCSNHIQNMISFGVQTQFQKNSPKIKNQRTQNSPMFIGSKTENVSPKKKFPNERKKVASILTSEQKKNSNNMTTTQRQSPVNSLISKFNQELMRKSKQNQQKSTVTSGNKHRISQNQNFRLNEFPQNSGKKTTTTRRRPNIFENLLFEQLNINQNQTNNFQKKFNLIKTPRIKFIENFQTNQRPIQIAIPSTQQKQAKIKQKEIIKNKQIENQVISFNELNSKKIQSQDFILQTMKNIQILNSSAVSSQQKYEKFILKLLQKATSKINEQTVIKAIEKFKQSSHSYQLQPLQSSQHAIIN